MPHAPPQKDCSLTDITCLEELIGNILTWNQQVDEKDRDKKQNRYYIKAQVFNQLWETFVKELENKDPAKNVDIMHNSLRIIRMSTIYQKDILNSNKYISLIEILKSQLKCQNPDWIIIQETAHVVEINRQHLKSDHINSFIKILLFLLIKFQGTDNNNWYCAAEKIIDMLFIAKTNSENLAQFLIKKCTKSLMSKDNNTLNVQTQDLIGEFPVTPNKEAIDSQAGPANQPNLLNAPSQALQPNQVTERATPLKTPVNAMEEEEEEMDNQGAKKSSNLFEIKLSQLLFIVGHVALKLLVYVSNIENELKRLKIEGEKKQEEHSKEQEGNELDKVYGGLEAEYERKMDQLHNIVETSILNQNLLSNYAPIVLQIIQDLLRDKRPQTRYPILDRVAVLTFSKFMILSQTFCQSNLDLMFKIIDSDVDYIIKTNIIISLGDLLHKYPNLVEPYTNTVYSK